MLDSVWFLAQLRAGLDVIMPWVAVAASGGLVLLMIYIGIRQGLRFFRIVAGGRVEEGGYWGGVDEYSLSAYDRADLEPEWLADYDAARAGGLSHNDAFDVAERSADSQSW